MLKKIKKQILNYLIKIFLKKSISLVIFVLLCNLDIININFFFIDF